MKISSQLRLSAGSFAVGLALAATPAFAQDADVTTDGAAEEEGNQILVTGSRLNVNPNLTSVSPVLAVDAEEIAVRGVVDIEDLTNALPQISAAQTADQSNGASGTSQLDLRGLGAQRTLTLIDGRRLPYGDSASIAVNLDLVPTQLVERVEVLTGGSSAVYGSDAVAGVVNFVLKDDFEGVAFDVQYGFAQSSNGREIFEQVLTAANQPFPTGSVTDGEEISASVTFGANIADGRGNVTGFLAYQNRNEISQADRTASACTIGASTGNFSANGFGCIGSANFRLFSGNAANGAPFFFQQEDGTITDFVGGPAETFNFGPQNFFQRPSERFQIYTKATYELDGGHELFADFGYTDVVSDAQVAPSASFGFFQRSINCGNPFIQDASRPGGGSIATDVLGCTAQQIADDEVITGLTASHRNVEGGPRNSRLENRAFRLVGGARGTFAEFFDYEVFGQFSATRDEDTSTNDFIIANLDQALLVTTDADGNAVCIDQSNGCVPYNIFQRGPGGESLVSQGALDFIQGVGITTGETEQLVLGGTIQTDLSEFGIQSPFAEDAGVGFLVGAEYREDTLDATPDQISRQPDGGFTGVGGPTLPVSGTLEVTEFFTELQLPLVTNRPFFEELVFSAQYRYSDYTANGNGTSNSFSTDTYGFQLSWAPTPDISFRGQFQRAVRAPNVVELFTGQSTGLPDLAQVGTDANGNGIFDPCSTAVPVASAAACANTGVTAAQFGNIPDVAAGQTQGLFGGNPNLTPESSDTITFGAVFQPTFLPGFNASVDYFDISIDDAIVAGLGAQTILDNCLETGEDVFCNLVQRDAAGSLNASGPGVGFTLTNVNAASLETSGLDFQVNYEYDLGSAGAISLNYASTYLFSSDFTPFLGAPTVECEGEFAGQCGQPTAQYRHRALLGWETPLEGLTANITWRHFGGVDNDSATPQPVELSLNAVNYFDLSVRYEVFDGIVARAGVNNVFEDNFPVSVSAGPANNGNGNTYPGVYDTGRFFFFGFSAEL
ncbi:TonB-dependent receptor [Erythrobacter longus]|uniref:TonB-dependent receptor n=1 Tax=Erythrobacter longus TaxID=1044 RepID=A0A074MC58_ERYLO|nr:TonB-dependent receptor [Erythrobacter longus]KEO90340.1 TonB-dependent receptor [Erythrobacter longus]